VGDSARMAHGALAGVSQPHVWLNLEHVTGAYSEHAKTKRYTQRRAAWGDAHRAAGTRRANGTSRKRNHRALPRGARA
jgi:hypothetical protein